MSRIPHARTPIIPWGTGERKTPDGRLNSIVPGTEHAEELRYSNNAALELVDPIKEPGSNLPAEVRSRLHKRDCFIVHSD